MNSAKAFAPGNISCIFVIKRTNNPRTSGSLGLGFTIDQGVIVTIRRASNSKKSSDRKINQNRQLKDEKNKQNAVYFNNKKINFPTVISVIKGLTREIIEVRIKSRLPLGCGFGLSGASALATAYALNSLLKLRKAKKDLAVIAHVAEVENMTGLGDVVNQFYGGFLAKYESSYKFKTRKMPIRNKTFYYRIFGKLSTKYIISNTKIKSSINKAGINALSKIRNLKKEDITFGELTKISNDFAEESGLLRDKNVINAIKKIKERKGNASMVMLGKAVFSDKKFRGCKKLKISDKCARVIQ